MVVFGGDDINSVVLDIGSYSIKAGFSGADLPRSVIPSLFGTVSDYPEKKLFGSSALAFQPNLEYSKIIENGILNDPECLASLIPFFNEDFYLPTEGLPLCFIESGFNSNENKASICEVLFENNCIPAIFIAKSPVTSSFALGKPTSLVVDIGAEFCVVSPIVDGFVLKNRNSLLFNS